MHHAVRASLLLALSACSAPPTQTTEAPLVPAPAPQTPPSPPPMPQPPPAPSPQVGVSAFVMASDEAEGLNHAALRAHQQHDYAGSLEGFTQALQASPGYAMARFNQACALSRLGRLEEAEALLMTLFEEDLPSFAQRFLEDEDLMALREGAPGARLRARIETLLPAMQAAWSRGALAYVHAPYGRTCEDRQTLALSMGVIDPATNRFVAIAPRASDALGMQIDREAGVAFVLHGSIACGTFWSDRYVPTEVDVLDLQRPIERIFRASLRTLHDYEHEVPSIAVQATRTYADVSFDHIDLAPPPEGNLRFRLTPTGAPRRTAPLTPREGTLWVRGNSPVLDREAPPSSEGLRFEQGELIRVATEGHAEVRVSLGERHTHPRLLLSPDGTRAFVRTESARCSYTRQATGHRGTFDLVELAQGTVTHIETDADAALFEGRFAADGTFYFQAGEVVRRYAPGSTEPVFDVPSNVVLTTRWMAWKIPVNCEI